MSRNPAGTITTSLYIRDPCYLFFYITAEADNLSESGSESESDSDVGAQAPPLTKQISNILSRYPEGGQILKVFLQLIIDIILLNTAIERQEIVGQCLVGVSLGHSPSVVVCG